MRMIGLRSRWQKWREWKQPWADGIEERRARALLERRLNRGELRCLRTNGYVEFESGGMTWRIWKPEPHQNYAKVTSLGTTPFKRKWIIEGTRWPKERLDKFFFGDWRTRGIYPEEMDVLPPSDNFLATYEFIKLAPNEADKLACG